MFFFNISPFYITMKTTLKCQQKGEGTFHFAFSCKHLIHTNDSYKLILENIKKATNVS